MHEQVAKFILFYVALGFVGGFLVGYALRAAISYHRRQTAQRHRLDMYLNHCESA